MTSTETIDINIDEGEALGAVINDSLQVTRIQDNSAASESQLRIGDIILKSKGVTIRSLRHFHDLMRYAPPCARLTVSRPIQQAASGTASTTTAIEVVPSVPQEDASIPEALKSMYTPQAGFAYTLVKVSVAPGEKLGLHLRSYKNRVLVPIDPPAGSKAHGVLKQYDHLVDISGTRVTDQHVAQYFIGLAVRKDGFFTSVVERPITADTQKQLHDELTAKAEPPSVTLAPDVRAIAQEERIRAAAKSAEDAAKRQRGEAVEELKPAPPTNPAARVTFNETSNKRHIIGNDNRGRDLKPVR